MFLPEDQVPPRIAAGVRGNYRIDPDHINPIDIRLDRYFFKGPATRNGVTIGVKTDGLIFVDAGWFGNVWIERMGRQGQSRRLVLLESFPNRLGFPRHSMLPFPQATLTQIGIELVPIVHLRDRRSPIPLQVIHTLLDIGLFLAAGRHTKQGFKPIMTGQGFVTRMQKPLPTFEYFPGYRSRIIPPHFPRYTVKKGKGLHHPRQNGLGPLGRQGHGKGKSRITPSGHQNRYLASSVRKIHIDMTEIRFQSPTGWMIQGNKGLPRPLALPLDIATHLIITPRIPPFIAEATIELTGRVPLLAGSLLIFCQYLLNDWLKWSQLGGIRLFLTGITTRFRLPKGLPNLPPGVM